MGYSDDIQGLLRMRSPLAFSVVSKLVNSDLEVEFSDFEILELMGGGISVRHKSWPATYATFIKNHVFCNAGSVKGNELQDLNQFLNCRMSDTVYHIDGNMIIKSDGLGRLQSSEAFFYSSCLDFRSKPDLKTQKNAKVDQDGNDDDEAGHSIQNSLGGPNEFVNLVPMSYMVNHSILSGVEAMEKTAVGLGLTVYSRRRYVYSGGSKRPTKIIVDSNAISSLDESKNVPQGFICSMVIDNNIKT